MNVLCDGIDVVPSSIGTTLPLDPGAHTIEADAAGFDAWSTTVEIGVEADHKTVTVPALKLFDPQSPFPDDKAAKPSHAIPQTAEFGEEADLKTAGAPAHQKGKATEVAQTAQLFSDDDIVAQQPSNSFLVAGIVATCLGGALTVFGAAFAALAAETVNESNIKKRAIIATVGLATGLAGTATGVTLIVRSSSSDQDEAQQDQGPVSLRLAPSLGPGGGGLSLIGAF